MANFIKDTIKYAKKGLTKRHASGTMSQTILETIPELTSGAKWVNHVFSHSPRKVL